MDPVAKQKERIKLRARWKVSKLKCMKRERIDSVNDDETTITRWLWWTGRTAYYWPWSNVMIKSKLIRSRAEFDCAWRYFCDDKISSSRIRFLCETRREFFAYVPFPPRSIRPKIHYENSSSSEYGEQYSPTRKKTVNEHVEIERFKRDFFSFPGFAGDSGFLNLKKLSSTTRSIDARFWRTRTDRVDPRLRVAC